ncbi:MAG: beta-ketoacyl-[acyl-carrier-protein] synthase II [Candidatus Marinimicrobia bacterium]|nr:beta-ketoacyl-[acyl-carrier-protein] synthase II [Candidatus Neomarinimicrobiota bacterium]|tara:strand:- start:108 stop:1346 length:1239 start_codon:yes stop_codon:yes gene_type:complete
MNKKRVVITGMGCLTPIGNSVKEFHNSIKTGKNGVAPITLFDTDLLSVKIAGEVKDLDMESFIERRELNRMDRFCAFGVIAADEAIHNSGLTKDNSNPERVGVIIGSGIGGIETLTDNHSKLLRSPRRVSPLFIPMMICDIAPGHVSMRHGFKGPNYSVVSACATGTHAIGDAFRMIKYGDADAIVAGGTEASVVPISVAGFSNMKALTKNPDPNTASRPFDKERNGFVLGEGAGVLVLEELEHALKRNANILGEICGYGATGDAYHLTSPAPNGEGAARAMKMAINDAQINTDEVNYINAHGTSTPFNDRNESIAIRTVFKNHANKLLVSSTKSMTGHLLGAAGGIEAIASILALKNGFIPPTINYKNFDFECDLNYVPNQAIEKDINYAMSNTFGFGGHNGVLLFKRFEV